MRNISIYVTIMSCMVMLSSFVSAGMVRQGRIATKSIGVVKGIRMPIIAKVSKVVLKNEPASKALTSAASAAIKKLTQKSDLESSSAKSKKPATDTDPSATKTDKPA